jgi:hypothetical protein
VINLVEEYFKRDLTAQEEAQLARLLAGSPDAAQKMAEGMAALHGESGHTVPAWPESPLPTIQEKDSRHWLKLILFALLNLALLGLLVRGFQALLQRPAPAPAAGVETSTLTLEEPVKITHKTAPRKTQPAPVPVQRESTMPALPPPSPMDTPPPFVSSGREFEQLSVVVNNPQPGLATIKVFNSQHDLVRRLYTGILPMGAQTIVWDGRTDEGGAAPAGTYQVEIQSGENVIRGEVKVKGGDSAP